VKNRPEFKSAEHRREKITEHSNLESRKSIRDKRFYVIDDDYEINRLMSDEIKGDEKE
jgi:hypothetical protein